MHLVRPADNQRTTRARLRVEAGASDGLSATLATCFGEALNVAGNKFVDSLFYTRCHVPRRAHEEELVALALNREPERRRALWEELVTQRARAAARVVRDVLRKGRLREGLDAATAADLLWLMNDPGIYVSLVHHRGRGPERYQAWLAETLQQQLLPA